MFPALRGVIDRRILVNYRVELDALAGALPDRFRPQTVDGYGVGGICLIRLRDVRPRFVPTLLGLSSENAAHRIAVEWDDDGERETGVYVPRRDTNSRLNALAGGSVFPGVHHRASFDVDESGGRYAVSMRSDDGETHVHVDGEPTDDLPVDSAFDSVSDASSFFECGSLGYSPNGDEFEGLELRTFDWEVTPLSIDSVASSYFDALPNDAVEFDHALLMRDVPHEWRERDSLSPSPA